MFKIIVGCYEQFIIGYTVNITQNNGKLSLKSERQFCDHTHLGCVKCVASNNTFVVSGSTDEAINIFNMKVNCDYGPLQGHSGSVNELLLPDEDGNRVVSCGEDGNICVWVIGLKKTGLLKTLRGHKAAISSISIHPSGKLAMSASIKDGSLRTWNMVTGRSCYIKNMKQLNIEFVRWSSSGNFYVLASNRMIQVFELASAKCVQEFKSDGLITAVKPLPLVNSLSSDEYIAIGDAAGFICIYSLSSGCMITRFKAHDNRVKDLHGFVPNFLEVATDEVWLASVSSDEKIKLWRIDAPLLGERGSDVAAECLLEINASARLTCVTVWKQTEDPKEHEKAQESESQEHVLKSSKEPVAEVLPKMEDNPSQELEKTNSFKKSKKKSALTKKKKLDSTVISDVKKSKSGKRKVSFDPEQISKTITEIKDGSQKERKRKKKNAKLNKI